MIFSLDVVRARKGDCLILHYGPRESPRVVLIDGGPSNVYRPHLKPRIDAIRNARNLAANEPLPVEVMMVSHVDDDHIKGILDLTRELRDLRQFQQPLPIRVGTLWHNTFDDLLDTTPKELAAAAGFGLATLAGAIEAPDDDAVDVALVLASIPQGRDLRLDAEFLKWKINRQFAGKLILAAGKSKPVTLDGGLKFTVAGPMKTEVEALQKAHDKWLAEQKKKGRVVAGAALAAFVDKSIPNLSSLVLLAEAGGRRILLTGDARGDKVLEGLQLVGLLGPGKTSTMRVDVLKVPHHGSANNATTGFFRRITADHYVFSGNGEHGNPERETLEMLFDARGNAPFVMHFTYPVADIDAERKADWQKQRLREQHRKQEGKKVRVRPVWSDAKHGLANMLAARQHPGQELLVVPGGAGNRHVIDLLDATTF